MGMMAYIQRLVCRIGGSDGGHTRHGRGGLSNSGVVFGSFGLWKWGETLTMQKMSTTQVGDLGEWTCGKGGDVGRFSQLSCFVVEH